MLYIMRRTQLYLDEDLWNALHFHARLNGQTISELVRKAARDKYMGQTLKNGAQPWKALSGYGKDREDIENSDIYIRKMRSGSRTEEAGTQVKILIDSDVVIEVFAGQGSVVAGEVVGADLLRR